MSKLVIVESPAKAKTIQKYLGEGFDVVASMGHIRDLPKSKLGIDIEHGFQPDYVEIKGKEELIKSLKADGKTILLASHNQGDIDELCDTVCEMDAGNMTMIREE